MYVEQFKFLLTLQNPAPLKPVLDDKIVTHHTCNGVVMDAPTHASLTAIVKDLKSRQNDLFKQFPNDYLVAANELIEEIQTTGKIPALNIHKRRSRGMGLELDLSDLSDEDFDEEEEEYKPDPEDESDEEVKKEVEKAAVSKPVVGKKTQARGKKETVKPKEAPAVKVDEAKSEEAPKRKAPGRKKAPAAKETAAAVEPASTPVDLSESS